MKIKHFGLFSKTMGSLLMPSSWETLRNSSQDEAYYLPYTIDDYQKKVKTKTPSFIASSIITKALQNNIDKIFSIGSGISALEYQIKYFSPLKVIVSDYNRSILRIKEFQLFDQCIMLDALKENIPINSEYMVIFPRIDTEFTDAELIALYRKCYNSDIEYIVFIPAQLLNFNVILSEIKILVKSILQFQKRTFCGYSRSKKEFMRLFGDYYSIDEEVKEEKIFFFLKRKRK